MRKAQRRFLIQGRSPLVHGVELNDVVNTVGKGTPLMSDGDTLNLLRAILAHWLTPSTLRPIPETVQTAPDTR